MAKIISYDKENDILVAHKGFSQGEKFKGNIEVGDLIMDLSTKMRIRGIEILNAKEYLKEFLKSVSTKKNILENIKDIRFSAVVKGNSITLALILVADVAEKEGRFQQRLLFPYQDQSFDKML